MLDRRGLQDISSIFRFQSAFTSSTCQSHSSGQPSQIFPYAVVTEILYFGLPSEWLLKHKGKPTCDFEAEFCSGITFRTGLDACFGTGLAMENRSPVPIFSENHRVLP